MTKRRAASDGARRGRPLPSRSISIKQAGSSILPKGLAAHSPSPKLVVLFVVQFVMNCFLALLLNQHHHNRSLTTSYAISTEAALVKRELFGRVVVSTSPLKPYDDANEVPNEKQQAAQLLHDESAALRDDDLLEDMLRRRPRWRWNPIGTSSATSSQHDDRPLARHNQFLTIEDSPVTYSSDANGRERGGGGRRSPPEEVDLFLEEEENIRHRRDQPQQQATSSSSANGNLNDRQRQHMKTRLEIQRAEQAYRNKLIEIRQRYLTNRAITDRAYYILLIIYAILITFGTISNSMICLTVLFKPKILSPRNLFIVNLAGSDLLLCVFTMPLTFIEVSMKIWQMGLIPCKLVAGLQATSIFVSTISITAIALDRYKVIVFPTHQETASGTRGALLLLASVWIGALAISLPLFTYRTVEHHAITSPTNQSEPFNLRSPNGLAPDSGQSAHSLDFGGVGMNQTGNKLERAAQQQATTTTPNSATSSLKQYPNQLVNSFDFCIEDWPFAHGRGVFSVVSMFLQYVLPISIVSFVYTKISRKLQKRLIRRQRLTQLECQQKRQLNLIKRTHTMLVSVSLVFGFSWLPLNLWNVASDFSAEFRQLFDDQTFRIIFAICHLIGCSSACSNPILYGFLNENFRKELQQVYNHHARLMLRRLRRLVDCLNWCWPIRKLLASCGLPVEMRDDEEMGGDSDEEEREGEISKMANCANKHPSRKISESSTRLGSLEKLHRQQVAGSISEYSSNLYTENDDDENDSDDNSDDHDDDSGSAFYSEPSASPTIECRNVLTPRVQRPRGASRGEHNLATPNVIPLSMMNLKSDGSLEEKLRYCNSSGRANRQRAESTPCPNRKLESPGAGVRYSVMLRSVNEQRGNCFRGDSLRGGVQRDSIRRMRQKGAGRVCCNNKSGGVDEGGLELTAATKAAQQTTDVKARPNRRVSYQAITSASRDDNRTIGGRAMRLCLCISSSSSSETIDGQAAAGVAPGALQATPNGLEPGSIPVGGAPLMENGLRANSIERSRELRVQQRAKRKQLELASREMPFRLLRCECKCHELVKLPQLANYDTRSLCEPARISELPMGTKTTNCRQPNSPAGRRVWLRFLGDNGAKGTPPASDENESLAMTGANKAPAGHNQGARQITVYADNSHEGRRPLVGQDVGRPMHGSQPDLLMRLVERKATGVIRDEARAGPVTMTVRELGLAGGNGAESFRSFNERNQSSGTTHDTIASGREQHCNICKHSSVSSAPGGLLPAPATGQRRLQRKRANQTRRQQQQLQRRRRRQRSPSSLLRRHKSRTGDANRFLGRHSRDAASQSTNKMAPMEVEQPGETPSTGAIATPPVKRCRALSSISSWIGGLRRKRSAGSGSRRHACTRSGDGEGGGGKEAGSSRTSWPTRSGDARSSSGLSVRSKAGAESCAKSNRSSASPASTGAHNNQNSTTHSSSATASAMRNNLHQNQAPVLIVGGGGGSPACHVMSQTATPTTTTLDPGGAPATRQVGTVYLSIEMDDNRKRADSIFSFDGQREKSTSVVVMMMEDDDELEAGTERQDVSGQASCSGQASRSACSSGQARQSSSNHTRTTTTAKTTSELPMNATLLQKNNPSSLGGENEQRRGQLEGVNDDYCENSGAQVRAIGRDDNFIDCCPVESGKSACADDIGDGPAQSKDNQRPSELRIGLERVESDSNDDEDDNSALARNRMAPTSPSAVATSTPPITIRSSNSSGSVSPSALSFTSACLLHHSSSMSSCTCSLTTSSFSSGQLTATNRTSTTRESSMSISTQATLSINISPRNSLPPHQQHHTHTHHNNRHNQQQQQQHTHNQHHLQAQTRNAPSQRGPSNGSTIKTTTNEAMATVRTEPLVWHRSVSSGSSQAAPSSSSGGRHRGQRQLELRQSRTHSATLGSDLGRTARAAALAAARYKSLRPQVAFDGAAPSAMAPATDQTGDESRSQASSGESTNETTTRTTTTTTTTTTTADAKQTEPAAESNHLSSFGAEDGAPH